jgi:hypothetical protein
MRHFRLEEWVDFARDIIDKGRRSAMQNHLESGCKECAKVLNLWQRVYEIGQRNSIHEPPASAVQSIKGLYVIHGGRARPKKTAVARLLFDSFAAPQTAGIRSAAASTRQLLYGTDEYRVDLRIEPQYDTEKVALIGQILNSQNPAEGVNAAPVVLLKKRVVRAFSVTNRFGEFHILCELERGLHLRFKLPQDTELSLPIVELAPDDSSDSRGISALVQKEKKGAGEIV